MPQHEVAEAKRLHDGAEQVDRLVVGEGVVEGHAMPHLLIRYCSTSDLSVLESAELNAMISPIPML